MSNNKKLDKITKKNERWLLTRKTWKYMQDAGRRLIPDGINPNNPDNLNKIEQNFNVICSNETKFLLWHRKNSYPQSNNEIKKYSLLKNKQKNLKKKKFDEHDKLMINILEKYLNENDSQLVSEQASGSASASASALPSTSASPSTSAPTSPTASTSHSHHHPIVSFDTINRKMHFWNYNRNNSNNINNEIITNIKSYIKNNRTKILNYNHLKSLDSLLKNHSLLRLFLNEVKTNYKLSHVTKSMENLDCDITHRHSFAGYINNNVSFNKNRKNVISYGTQTDHLSKEIIRNLKDEYLCKQKQSEKEKCVGNSDNEIDKRDEEKEQGNFVVDNEDVSESVSNTIKRYLNMARKKNNKNDNDRFKRINYDRNLRSIKSKFIPSDISENTDHDKSCQTNPDWATSAFEFDSHSNLNYNTNNNNKNNNNNGTNKNNNYSSLLYNRRDSSPQYNNYTSSKSLNTNKTNNMQKSKSSTNVGHLVSKKIFKSRSKSQTRLPSSVAKPQWMPQGNCVWTTSDGRRIHLPDTNLQNLTDVERKLLHRVAVEKLQQLNFGINVSPPNDNSNSTKSSSGGSTNNNINQPKPKRRTLLLKRKALTTGFFDSDKDSKNSSGSSFGLVFGLPLEQCLENDYRENQENYKRLLGGSSYSSLLNNDRDKSKLISGSCESLPSIRLHLSLPDNYDDSDNSFNSEKQKSLVSSFSQSDIRRNSRDDNDLDGIDINDRDYHFTHNRVPKLVISCIKYLENHGMNTIGIFRVSTSKKRVRQLREEFDRGLIKTLDSDICPHDVATLLKEYLRDLPEPLLCYSLYSAFVKTQKIRNRRLQLEAMSYLVQLLPVAHRDTLYVLLKFLSKVAKHSTDVVTSNGDIVSVGNKMDSSNLATVFAPNILHCSKPGKQTTEQEVDERIDVINIIRTMIDHYEELFVIPSEIMDEIYTTMMETNPQQLDSLCERFDMNNEDNSFNDDSSASHQSLSLNIGTTYSLSGDDEVTQSTDNLRKIYSRENLLHGNAGRGLNAENKSRHSISNSSNMKDVPHNSSSLTPNQHQSQSILRRRRDTQTNRGTNESNDAHSTDSQHRIYGSSQSKNKIRSSSSDLTGSTISNCNNMTISNNNDSNNMINDRNNIEMSRRMSSPLISKSFNNKSNFNSSTEVLTASLQIPVQVQQQQQNLNENQNSQILNLNMSDDYYDIPYIEDGCSTIGVPSSLKTNKMPSSSLSIFNQDKARETRNQEHRKIQHQKSVGPPNSSLAHRKLSQSSSLSKIQLSDPSTSFHQHIIQSPIPSYTPLNLNNNFHFEPKLTPSISNIGVDVMKSKTADFEKKGGKTLTDRNNQYSSTPTSKSSSVPSMFSSAASTNDSKNQQVRSRPGQIYKRQSIISSVQNMKKK